MAKVICLDLEMNQPSNKIIQLGYVIGDVVSERIFVERSLIINPYERLGFLLEEPEKTITELTGITQEQVDAGMSLQEAYQIMCDDIKKHNPTTTPLQWGMGDSDEIRKQLELTIEDYVFRKRVFDAKGLYQTYKLFQNQGVAAGLEKAMMSLGLQFEGRAHDALVDAKNTFLLFIELGKRLTLADKLKKLLK